MLLPSTLKYTQDHIWLEINYDFTATIGITDFAQKELGEIIYIDADNEEKFLTKNQIFSTVEAVKTVSDLFMPLDGAILQFNPRLQDEPELVNNQPYNDGWIAKIRIANKEQINELLTQQQYANLIGEK